MAPHAATAPSFLKDARSHSLGASYRFRSSKGNGSNSARRYSALRPLIERNWIWISPQYSHSSWRQAPQGGVIVAASVTTAISRNSCAPSLNAFHNATRSAHTLSP